MDNPSIYKTIFNLCTTCMTISRLKDGMYLDVNESFCRDYGYSKEEVIGKLSVTLGVLSAEDREKLQSAIQSDECLNEYFVKTYTKSGKEIEGLFSAKIITYKGEKCILGNYSRIHSELKKIKKNIDSVELISKLLKNIPEGLAILNSNLDYLYVNEALATINGMSVKENTGINVRDLFGTNKHELFDIFQQVIEQKKSFSDIHLEIPKEDYIRHFSLNAFPIFQVDSSVSHLGVLVTEITDGRKTRNELIKLQTAVDQSANGIIITDTEGKITYVNLIYQKKTGFSSDELIGQNPRILKSGHHEKEFYENIWNTIKSGEKWTGEICNKDKNEKLFWEKATIAPVFNDKNEIIYFIAIKEDITDKKEWKKAKLKATIQAEEKEKQRFAEDLHDELGPYLSSIRLHINALSDVEDEKQKAEILNDLDQMIDESISKIKTLSYNLMPTVLLDYGLINAIEAYINRMQNISTLNIKLNANTDKTEASQEVEIILYRVLMELINNTIKHSGAKNIKISFTENSENIHLYYEDDGKPFDMENSILYKGMGLKNIINRLKSIDATYTMGTKTRNSFNIISPKK